MIKTMFTKLGIILCGLTLITNCGLKNNSITTQSIVQNQTIKIGVITALSGNNVLLGAGTRNAAQMALEEIQTQQRLKNNYQLIFEDDQTDAKKTITALNKLIGTDQIMAVLSFASNAGNAVAPTAEQAKIIHFSAASDPNVAQGLYNFIHWTQPQQEAEKVMQKLRREKNNSIAMIQLIHEGAVSLSNTIEKLAQQNNVVTYIESVSPKESDFKTIILKMEEKNPSLYYTYFWSPQIENFVKQFKELEINKPLTTIEAFEYSPTPELFNDYWYVSAAEPTNQFRDNYLERYKINPTIASGNAYDMVSILIWAYENVTDPNNNELIARKILELKDWPGALGNLNITEEGIIISQAALKKVVDGEFVVIEE